MSSYQIVIDTNVIIAAFRSRRGASNKLLSIIRDERWELNISNTLIFEYEEILKQQQNELGLSLEYIEQIISFICQIANQHQIFYLWRPLTPDPDDDFIVELAIEAQADFIITYNQKDLKIAERFGIQVITPKQFLQSVGELLS